MNTIKKFDIVVIGNGIVGLTIAYSLFKKGFNIAIMRNKNFIKTSKNNIDLRFSAINNFSKNFLKYLGIWEKIKCNSENYYYNGIDIWEKDGFGFLSFDNKDVGYKKLGYVIKNNDIKGILLKKIKIEKVNQIFYSRIIKIDLYENKLLIFTEKYKVLTKLLIGADGCSSWLRNYFGIKVKKYNYGSCSIVTNICTMHPHQKRLRQIFNKNSIIALLPLRNPNKNHMIWTLPCKMAKQIIEKDNYEINRIISVYTDMNLGLCKIKDEKRIFHIFGHYLDQDLSNNFFLVGDSAHTIHPLGGQGLNLGLSNIYYLFKTICKINEGKRSLNNNLNFKDYNYFFKRNMFNMFLIMHLIYILFSSENKSKFIIRNFGLNILNKSNYLKCLISKYAMGLLI